jgi:hemerythrin-like domain-containing protein
MAEAKPMRATEDLKQEHRVIELVLTALEGMAQQLERGNLLRREPAERALEVVRNFADKCHHGKEERYLFKRLETRGMSRQTGIISELLHEHGEGRAHVRAFARALVGACENNPQDGRAFAQHAQGYVTLLRKHIQKEDDVFFPMADQKLTPEDDAELMEAFEKIEREEIGEGAHEKYHRWAVELAQQKE